MNNAITYHYLFILFKICIITYFEAPLSIRNYIFSFVFFVLLYRIGNFCARVDEGICGEGIYKLTKERQAVRGHASFPVSSRAPMDE